MQSWKLIKTTRKPHKCINRGHEIPAGSPMWRFFAVGQEEENAEPTSGKMCVPCYNLLARISEKLEPDDSVFFENLEQEAKDFGFGKNCQSAEWTRNIKEDMAP